MSFDFPTILVLLSFFTGLVWAFDKFYLQKKISASASASAAGSAGDALVNTREAKLSAHWFVDTGRSLFPVIFVVLILRSFVVEPFRIPSESMVPTLLTGDFILVNKFTYGIRLPVIDKKVINIGEPERGDVVVFRFPRDTKVDYIKRVVGLPGDKISYKNKQIWINDEPVDMVNMGPAPEDGFKQMFVETLGDVEHKVYVDLRFRPEDGEYRVPEGHYFMMGDNRDNSFDSRGWGFVPEDNLVGQAFLIWMHFDMSQWSAKLGRIGDVIE